MNRANAARGETELEVEGKILVLRPTLQCNLLIEQLTGLKYYGLLNHLSDANTASLKVVVDIVTTGIRSGPDKDIKSAELEDFLDRAGPGLLLETASNFIVRALGVDKMMMEAKAKAGNAGSSTATS